MEKRLNIHEAKTHLSRELARLKPGDRLILCNRNRPVAEIRTLRTQPARRRRLGLARGEFTVPEAFFEPLPDQVLEAFEGRR